MPISRFKGTKTHPISGVPTTRLLSPTNEEKATISPLPINLFPLSRDYFPGANRNDLHYKLLWNCPSILSLIYNSYLASYSGRYYDLILHMQKLGSELK